MREKEAVFSVIRQDLNFQDWVKSRGCEFLRLKPSPLGDFELYVKGDEVALDALVQDIGYEPNEVRV